MKSAKKLFVLILTTVLMISMLAVPADAATRRSVKVLSNASARTCAQLNRYATKLHSGSNYMKVGYMATSKSGWMRYTAKTAGTYSFKLSGISSGNAHIFGNTSFETPMSYLYSYANNTYPSSLKVSTKGGKGYTLWLCSGNVKTSGTNIYSYLHSRSAKVRLKKGQTIYIRSYFTTARNKQTKFTVKVTKIK